MYSCYFYQRILVFCVFAFSIFVASPSSAANPSDPQSAVAKPNTTEFTITNKTKMKQIMALPDDKMVRASSGRMVRAGNLKALANMIKTARTQGSAPKPVTRFSGTQAAPQVQLGQGVNLRELRSRKDTDVVQLPSGRKFTVSEYKRIDDLAKVITGTSLTDRQPPVPSTKGTAIRIKNKKEIEALASKPDSTVLEGPLGKRITLGELRAYAKKTNKPVGVR